MPYSIDVLRPLVARCCTTHHWQKRRDGHPGHVQAALTEARLEAHLGAGFGVGLCPMVPGGDTTRVAVLDLDDHDGELSWDAMAGGAAHLDGKLRLLGLRANRFRSSGGAGIHLIFLWDVPQDARSVREALRQVLGDCGCDVGTRGVGRHEVEVFPKQDRVPAKGWGSMFVLPLNGKSRWLDERYQDCEPGVWVLSEPVPLAGLPEGARIAAGGPGGGPGGGPANATERRRLQSALDGIPTACISQMGYDQWRNVIFGIHHATGGDAEGQAMACAWSARSAKHDADFLATRVWPYVSSARETVITANVIYHEAATHGWLDPEIEAQMIAAGALENTEEKQEPKKNRFRSIPAVEFAIPQAVEYLIENVLPRAALGVIYGESGSGKTFLALDMAGAVARGVAWRSSATVPGRVVYICAEGPGGFRKRLAAYIQEHQLTAFAMDVIPEAPNFMLVPDVKAIIAELQRLGEVSLVVVDTLAQVTPGANENAGEDMGKALYHCGRIHHATGAMVLLIHHAGKDAAKGARGWSGLRAACDFEMEITRYNGDRTAHITKLKDGEDGAELGFRLHTVAVAIDAHNAPVTSCIVEHTDATPQAAQKRMAPRNDKEKAVLKALKTERMLGADGVEREELTALAAALLPEHLDEKRQRRREYAARAVAELLHRGVLVLSGGLIFERDAPDPVRE